MDTGTKTQNDGWKKEGMGRREDGQKFGQMDKLIEGGMDRWTNRWPDK